LNRIYKNDRTVRYVENVKDIHNYLPKDDILMSVKILDNKDRKLLYKNSGWYFVEHTTKEKGVYEGNICPLCESGEMVNMGGCMTCNNCNSQLKCGL